LGIVLMVRECRVSDVMNVLMLLPGCMNRYRTDRTINVSSFFSSV
jgi:hypothetical protein